MRLTLATTCCLLALLSQLQACSSPPQPPTVDESRKRPANPPLALDLQSCRHDLHNTRLLAQELTQSEDPRRRLTAVRGTVASPPSATAAGAGAGANGIYVIRFAYGSTRVTLPPETSSALVGEARAAPLVILRGRTDGTRDSRADTRIAQSRADSVRRYLITAGVEASRIRATHQGQGDPAADNDTAQGRALNRRVEVEIYRQLPVTLNPPVLVRTDVAAARPVAARP